MFGHLFLLTNNKYFLIHNNNKNYTLFDAINEFSKHKIITNNNLSFISHIETKLINNQNLINHYTKLYGYTNLLTDNNHDRWSYYGVNYIQRFKNPIINSKILTS
jgi:hypothetical protein